MTDYKDGDVITVNGKPCRIEGGALVPVVERGPLGGELKRLDSYEDSEVYFAKVDLVELNYNEKYCDLYLGESHEKIRIPLINALTINLETNIPPRPTFTPMTAGEAAKVSGIAGRWVAVKVGKNDKSKVPLGVAITENGHSWLPYNAEILLIEGVDLP